MRRVSPFRNRRMCAKMSCGGTGMRRENCAKNGIWRRKKWSGPGATTGDGQSKSGERRKFAPPASQRPSILGRSRTPIRRSVDRPNPSPNDTMKCTCPTGRSGRRTPRPGNKLQRGSRPNQKPNGATDSSSFSPKLLLPYCHMLHFDLL
jgi:hypothetical protein